MAGHGRNPRCQRLRLQVSLICPLRALILLRIRIKSFLSARIGACRCARLLLRIRRFCCPPGALTALPALFPGLFFLLRKDQFWLKGMIPRLLRAGWIDSARIECLRLPVVDAADLLPADLAEDQIDGREDFLPGSEVFSQVHPEVSALIFRQGVSPVLFHENVGI